MRELEIQGVSRRRGSIRTTTPDKRAAPGPDLVNRDFTATRPNETWVADITYVPTHEGWLFLAAVMDLYSRKIVGVESVNVTRTPNRVGSTPRRDWAYVDVTVDPYCPETFRSDGHALIELLADYLERTARREGKVLDFVFAG